MFERIKEKIALRKIKRELAHPVKMYWVFDQAPEQNPDTGDFITKPRTICSTFEEAKECSSRLLYYKHIDHYRQWTDKKIEENDKENNVTTDDTTKEILKGYNSIYWLMYLVTVIGEMRDKEFPIYSVAYSPIQIASIFRSVTKCAPVYLPHEQPVEINTYLHDNIDSTGRFVLPDEINHAMAIDADLRNEIIEMYRKTDATEVQWGDVNEEFDKIDEELAEAEKAALGGASATPDDSLSHTALRKEKNFTKN